MPAAAIPIATSLIGGGLSAWGASKPRTSTSSYDNKSTQEGVLDPKQNKVMKALFQQILAAIKLGPQVAQGDRNTARTDINKQFNAAGSNVEANLAARGIGKGGSYGKELNKLEVGRATTTQSAEANLRDQAMARFMSMLGIGQNFITPRTFNTTSSGTQTGQASGTPWQSSLGGGVSDAGSYLYLRKLMGQGGGGGGSAPGYDPNAWSYGVCWIAMELWGASDWRVKVLREWLLKKAKESWKWTVGVGIYKGTGRGVALMIRHVRCLRVPTLKLFEGLLVQAMNG